MTIICPYCEKKPDEIPEYVNMARDLNENIKENGGVTPEEVVIGQEGTYDYRTKLFACTSCYVKVGQPTNQRLHEAFRYFRRDVEPCDGLDMSYIGQY